MARYLTLLLLTYVLYGQSVSAQNLAWMGTSGAPESPIFEFVSDPDGTLYASAANTDVELLRSTDGGLTWEEVAFPSLRNYISALAITNTGTLLAGTEGQFVFRSTNLSDSWEQIEHGSHRIPALAVARGGEIFAGSAPGVPESVYRSSDDGLTWQPAANGLFENQVYALATGPSQHVYAGTPQGVFVSSDNGDSWVHTSLQDADVSALGVGKGYVIAGTFDGRIFRSTDSGQTWELGRLEVETDWIHEIAINAEGHLYAATGVERLGYRKGGVFRSLDDGETWELIGSPSLLALSITFSEQGFVVVGTTSGILRSTASSTALRAIPSPKLSGTALSKNYPNPFDAHTEITFSIPKPSRISVKIYDSQGRTVAVLAQEFRAAGEYKVGWDASDFPSGIYFCKLEDGNSVQTQKLVLSR